MIFRLQKAIFSIVMLVCATIAHAQIVGTVFDSESGDTIPFASVSYKGHRIAVSGNQHGSYKIQRHNGWKLTFSSVGYKPVTVAISEDIPDMLNIRMKPTQTDLSEVLVKSKKSKYSRKENPAVELMRRVIAAKKRNRLENRDFYKFDNYEKTTLAFNDIKPEDLDSGFFAKKQWARNQIEACTYNNKLILPILVNEKVTRKIYRKNPQDEKTIVMGERSEGVNDLFETGEILDVMIKDVFTEVDIYDDQIRLLQQHFSSPIGSDAIGFYRYYIVDTLKIDNDSCYHLTFIPNNQQDFGFRGELYILKDPSLHVKRVSLTIPKRSDINFVEDMRIEQEYTHLDNGEWVLTTNDMIVEMMINKMLSKFIVVRTSRKTDYAFEEIDKKLFRGKLKETKDPNAELRNEDFWQAHRKVALTNSEGSISRFINDIKHLKGFNWIMFFGKALVENFVETGINGKPSKVDIGPVNTIVSTNYIDGLRLRMSGQTTASLNKHLFFKGYIAHGFNTKNNYYNGNITYSFNEKAHLPEEFPIRRVTLSSSYDICSPSDKFVHTDKDNVFTALKWSKVQKMMFYNRHKLEFEREEAVGFKTLVSLKVEENEATGGLLFKPLSDYAADGIKYEGGAWEDYYKLDEKSIHNGKIRTTELHFEIEFSPGRTYVNTKQRRIPINREASIFNLSHTMGISGFMGGQYSYNATEAMIYKRLWLNSWGKMDFCFKGGIQWTQVPYPLLIAPAANLSYILHDQTFNLINNMEFLNDRYASLDWKWNLTGKLFNRFPLIKHLKWREMIGVKVLWGALSDKNNPTLEENWTSNKLMAFPEGCYTMDPKKPYVELSAGIHNIFRFFYVSYVRRLNYLDLPTASKQGIRIGFKLEF